MLLAHGSGICPLEIAALLAGLSSVGGFSGLLSFLRFKLGL